MTIEYEYAHGLSSYHCRRTAPGDTVIAPDVGIGAILMAATSFAMGAAAKNNPQERGP